MRARFPKIHQRMEVLKSDQEDINRFSLLSTKSLYQMDIVEAARRQLENSREALEELDLICINDVEFDEEEGRVPVQCGSGYLHVPFGTAKGGVEAEIGRLEDEKKQAEQRMSALKDEMATLKERLYVKFGDAIQLELDPSTAKRPK